MNKTYSISEIVEASNNILNRPQKNSKTNKNYRSKESAELNKPLVLTKEYISQKEETINNEEVKKEILEEIHNFFKKKIKKNTLKFIFEQQQEIKKFQKKNNYLNENEKILKASNRNILFNLLKIAKNKKLSSWY